MLLKKCVWFAAVAGFEGAGGAGILVFEAI